jgi:hypothetical protein
LWLLLKIISSSLVHMYIIVYTVSINNCQTVDLVKSLQIMKTQAPPRSASSILSGETQVLFLDYARELMVSTIYK